MIIRRKLPVLAGLLLNLGPGSVNAQVLEEITVTAQKREQSIQDVGIAITAISGAQMEALGFDNAQQITAQVPGATTIQPNGPSAFFTSIRGVGQNDFSGDHQESPVAVYVDEVYISAAAGAGFQLFDMERVEVLRGPQGTLFGRNATGGLVHYVTRKPGEELEAYVKLTAASYNQIKAEGAIGGGLGDAVSGRLSFVRNKHDPYIENRIGTDLNNGDDFALRGQLLFGIGERTDWLLSARYSEQDIDTGFFDHQVARLNAQGLGEAAPGLRDFQDLGDSRAPAYADDDGDVYAGAYNVVGFNELEIAGATSNLRWAGERFDLVSITDFSTLKKDYIEDSDASPNDFFSFFLKSDLEQFSQEFRLSGGAGRHRWVAGLYYLDIGGDFANGGIAQNFFAAQFPGFGLNDPSLNFLGLNNPFSTDTRSSALFGQIDYELSDRWQFTAGLRLTREEKAMDFVSNFALFKNSNRSEPVLTNDGFGAGGPYFIYNGVSAGAGPTAVAFDFTETERPDNTIDKNMITAKLQLDYRPSDDTLVYVSYNRGIKAGGFNAPLDPTDLIDGVPENGTIRNMRFDEEVLNAYEMGSKTTFADGRARLNASVYYYDYNDYQAFRLEGLTLFVFNTDSTIYGGEIEIQASPGAGWDLQLGVAYINAEVEDAYRTPGGDVLDREPVLTPELTINGLARYEWDFDSGSFSLQGDFSYLSDHYFQLKNSPIGKQSAYTLVNLRGTWRAESEQWSISAFVDNLTDEEYRMMVFDLAAPPAGAGFGLAENYYGTPRWYGVSFTYNF